MEGSKYVFEPFEAKTIQRMEILVLSTLKWKMNPVTPLSFLDYFTRRFGLKDYIFGEFLKRCERIILCVISGKPSETFIFLIITYPPKSVINLTKKMTILL